MTIVTEFASDVTLQKTVTVPVADIAVTYAETNGIFDVQKMMYVEIMIEYEGEMTLNVSEARFVAAE